MSLQGAVLVVAEQPAAHLTEALRAAGACPVIESNWSDAPLAFVSSKPIAVVIAEPNEPPNEAAARTLCLQIVTKLGAIVPVVARTQDGVQNPLPIAVPADISLPDDAVVSMLRDALSACASPVAAE